MRTPLATPILVFDKKKEWCGGAVQKKIIIITEWALFRDSPSNGVVFTGA